MAAGEPNRERQVPPRIAPAKGPVPTSCIRYKVVDEASLLEAYDAHLRLLENRPKRTADTYRTYVKCFLCYLAINYPSLDLCEVTKLQVRAFFLPSRVWCDRAFPNGVLCVPEHRSESLTLPSDSPASSFGRGRSGTADGAAREDCSSRPQRCRWQRSCA